MLAELRSGGVNSQTRRNLAIKGFAQTTRYDAAISAYLAPDGAFTFQAYPVQVLRYGENPHQAAALYGYEPGAGPLGGSRFATGGDQPFGAFVANAGTGGSSHASDRDALLGQAEAPPSGVQIRHSSTQ